MQVVIVAKLTKRDEFIIIEYVPYHQAVDGSVRDCSIRSLSCWLQMILITMRTPTALPQSPNIRCNEDLTQSAAHWLLHLLLRFHPTVFLQFVYTWLNNP